MSMFLLPNFALDLHGACRLAHLILTSFTPTYQPLVTPYPGTRLTLSPSPGAKSETRRRDDRLFLPIIALF